MRNHGCCIVQKLWAREGRHLSSWTWFLSALFIALSLLSFACSDNKSTPDGSVIKDASQDSPLQESGAGGTTIGPQGGTFTSADKVLTVTIPPDALTDDKTFSITVADVAGLGSIEGKASDVYDLKPDGVAFQRAVALSFAYTGTPGEGKKVFVSRYDTPSKTWKELPGSILVDGRVTAMTDHFSTFVLQTGQGQQPSPITNVVVEPAVLMKDQPPEPWSRRWAVKSRTVKISGQVLPDGQGRWETLNTKAGGTFTITNGFFSFDYTLPDKNFSYPILYSDNDYTQYWLELWCDTTCDAPPDGGPTPDVSPDAGPAPVGPSPLWSRGYGLQAKTNPGGMVVDAANNIYVVGTLSESTNVGGSTLTVLGQYDIFLAKYDASGQHVWSKNFGGAVNEWGSALAIDSAGNLLFTGQYSTTFDFEGTNIPGGSFGFRIYVAKYDSDGNKIWVKGYGVNGTSNKAGYGIAVDASNNVFVTGSYTEVLDFGGPPLPDTQYDDAVFLAKLDSNGDYVWSRGFPPGAGNMARGYAVAVDSAGDVVMGGSEYGGVTLGGSAILGGTSWNGFIAKYNGANGVHQWSTGIGTTSQMSGVDAISFDAADNPVIVGEFDSWDTNNPRILLAKHSVSTGVEKWRRGFGTYNARLESVQVDASDNIIVAGWFTGSVDLGDGIRTGLGTRDILLARFDSTGQSLLWGKNWGVASGYNNGSAVALDSADDVIMTGTYSNAMDFGNGALPGGGMVLLKMAK